MSPAIDEQFYSPRLPISIVALPNNDLETQAIRALLESLGCAVMIHWIGTPTDFLKVLGQGETAPRYLLIAGHGEEDNGYYLGEYADFIDTSMLRGQYLPAEVIAPVVNLPGCTVVSSACAGGVEAMGRAFIQTGRIQAYIGCRVYPNGDDMLVWLVNFFYNIRRRKLSDQEAWQQAMVVTDQHDIYEMSFFHADGTESRYAPDGD
ncbi:MAG: CHAT domain-containing protein [Anaerolineae bacterium]|nr:CHAT domain-containing protein [Anaerolineae bacterium]